MIRDPGRPNIVVPIPNTCAQSPRPRAHDAAGAGAHAARSAARRGSGGPGERHFSDAACPLSTRRGTRLVRLVRGRGGRADPANDTAFLVQLGASLAEARGEEAGALLSAAGRAARGTEQAPAFSGGPVFGTEQAAQLWARRYARRGGGGKACGAV